MTSMKKIASAFVGISAILAVFDVSAFAQAKGTYSKIELSGADCAAKFYLPLKGGKGEKVDLFQYRMNGGIRLILSHTDAVGNVNEYALSTSEEGVMTYLSALYRNEPTTTRYVATGYGYGSSYEEHTDRANTIETLQSVLRGDKQVKEMGLFGPKLYHAENPIHAADRGDVLRELVNDACAYEARVLKEQVEVQKIAENSNKDGEWMRAELNKRLDPNNWVGGASTNSAN